MVKLLLLILKIFICVENMLYCKQHHSLRPSKQITWEGEVHGTSTSQKTASAQKHLFCSITVEYFTVTYKCYIDYRIKRTVPFQQQQKGTLSHMHIAFSQRTHIFGEETKNTARTTQPNQRNTAHGDRR